MSLPTKYLSLRIGRQEFLIASSDVRAVVPLCDLKPTVHPRHWVIGTVQAGGWESPVVSLRERLGVPLGSRGRKPVIIVMQMHSDEGPRWIGVVAEHAGDVLSLRKDDFRNGAARISGRQKRLIDLSELLSTDDLRSLLEPAVLTGAPLATS